MKIVILHHPDDAITAAEVARFFFMLKRQGHELVMMGTESADVPAKCLLLALLSPSFAEWWLDNGGALEARPPTSSYRFVPILLRKCELPGWLVGLMSLPRSGPLSKMDLDEASTQIVREVRGILAGMF